MSLHYLRPYPFVLVSLFPTSTLRIDPADQWSMTNEVSDNVLASLTTRLRGGRKQLSPLSLVLTSKPTGLFIDGLGGGERGLMHLVPAPAVKLMKSRVLSRPGVKKVEVRWCWVLTDGRVITS